MPFVDKGTALLFTGNKASHSSLDKRGWSALPSRNVDDIFAKLDALKESAMQLNHLDTAQTLTVQVSMPRLLLMAQGIKLSSMSCAGNYEGLSAYEVCASAFHALASEVLRESRRAC